MALPIIHANHPSAGGLFQMGGVRGGGRLDGKDWAAPWFAGLRTGLAQWAARHVPWLPAGCTVGGMVCRAPHRARAMGRQACALASGYPGWALRVWWGNGVMLRFWTGLPGNGQAVDN